MHKKIKEDNQKMRQLAEVQVSHSGGHLTTDQGVGINNTDDTLKAGARGPSLLEDFHFREKIMHFDHERIPERVVHARGTGAHGFFQVYESLSDLTSAHFLSDPNLITPVFTRFSTVVGSRGSADTARDIRGFAVKFYTQDGNYDLVGNNAPVFFIQDGIKFPDLIHAVKPEPNNEMPQGASAHDTFWDFVTSAPEALHTAFWLMSPRALPRSFRMMEGFGVHTYRLVNAKGDFHFVKFHWKPVLGLHSLCWSEAQEISGKDPDFHRRDLYNNIESGNYAEFEFGIQVLKPEQEFDFDFDLLDPTKLWPEELIPVRRVGKMTLNQNVSNFFAETEQAAFCPGNIVPGIDFTNDPLLQGRLFSYMDTQISRLGGPNFHQIPINRSVASVNNNQRDGLHQHRIDLGQTSYSPNALNQNEPHPARGKERAFTALPDPVRGKICRERSSSFNDHVTQPALFWNSMAEFEKKHMIDAFRFELGKCNNHDTRQKLVNLLARVATDLAKAVGEGLGNLTPAPAEPAHPKPKSSPALSIANSIKTPKTSRVAILIETGFDRAQYDPVAKAITDAGADFDIISGKLGMVAANDDSTLEANQNYALTASVLYDAVFVPGGAHVNVLRPACDVRKFLEESYGHFKTIGLSGDALCLLPGAANEPPCLQGDPRAGILLNESASDLDSFAKDFIAALTLSRHFARCAAPCLELDKPKVALKEH